ncbi:MAG: hypothetical protein NW202_09705 [Nitrospira sp.]|nr:hypothetical protein [Nitrospira sp.]
MIRGHHFRLVFIALYVLLLPTPALSQSTPSLPVKQVDGEVLMFTRELVVVKLADDTRMLFRLEKDTPMDVSLKVADRVEVRFTSADRVISVKKLTTGSEPQ